MQLIEAFTEASVKAATRIKTPIALARAG